MTQDPILVLGATGKTGRRVLQRLRARDVPVRARARSSDPPFDWDDRSTWTPAVRGTAAAYVAFAPDVAVPGASDTIGAFAEHALDAGCRRLVLLSGRGEAEAQRAERVLAASGAEWTVLRSSWFMQNCSEEYFLDQILAGVVAVPAGDVPTPFVDADDIADVAVAALTEDGHAGRLYELTGPRALTHGEAIAEIARASGRDVRYQPISLDAFVAGATADGVPAEIVSLLAYLYDEVLVESNAGVADGVRQVLGREPRAFADCARATAATGVWNVRAAA